MNRNRKQLDNSFSNLHTPVSKAHRFKKIRLPEIKPHKRVVSQLKSTFPRNLTSMSNTFKEHSQNLLKKSSLGRSSILRLSIPSSNEIMTLDTMHSNCSTGPLKSRQCVSTMQSSQMHFWKMPHLSEPQLENYKLYY